MESLRAFAVSVQIRVEDGLCAVWAFSPDTPLHSVVTQANYFEVPDTIPIKLPPILMIQAPTLEPL